MSVNFELNGNERLLRDETVLWMKAKLNGQAGRLYLTDKRLVFVKNANPLAGPLLRLFVKSAQQSLLYDIALGSISDTSKETFGANKILVVNYEGGKQVKFGLGRSFDEWQRALQEVNVKSAV